VKKLANVMKVRSFAIIIGLLAAGGLGSCKKEARIYRPFDPDRWQTHIEGTYRMVSWSWWDFDPSTGISSDSTYTDGCFTSARYIFKAGNVFVHEKSTCALDTSYTGTYTLKYNKLSWKSDDGKQSTYAEMDSVTNTGFVLTWSDKYGGQNQKFTKVNK
jgi:hypothetical protein